MADDYQSQHIGARFMYAGVQFDKYLKPAEYERLNQAVKENLLQIIDRYSQNQPIASLPKTVILGYVSNGQFYAFSS